MNKTTHLSPDREFARAFHAGNLPAMRAALALGADANAPHQSGCTPLHVAIECGRDDIVFLLLAHGANPNAKDSSGYSPLQLAVEHSHSNLSQVDCVKALLEHGGDATAVDKFGVPLLFCALNNTKQHIEKSTGCAIIAPLVRLLLDFGADPQERCDGSTALLYAVKEKVADAVAVLLERGADIHARDGHGKRPIDYCDDSLGNPRFDPTIRTMLRAHEDAHSLAAALDAQLPPSAPTRTLARI